MLFSKYSIRHCPVFFFIVMWMGRRKWNVQTESCTIGVGGMKDGISPAFGIDILEIIEYYKNVTQNNKYIRECTEGYEVHR